MGEPTPDADRSAAVIEPHPDDRAQLEAIRGANAWVRGLACTLARRGVAFRQADAARSRALLDALSTWPAYRAGQLLFDLLELEDFMVDGEQPDVVLTTLPPAALHRLGELLRAVQRYLDGAQPDRVAIAVAPAALQRVTGLLRAVKRHLDGALRGHDGQVAAPHPPPADLAATLPPLEAGFYLYDDVVLGLWASTRAPAARDPPPAPSGPAVAITHVHARGEVRRVQSDEYVEVTNRGLRAHDVSGWRLDAGDGRQSFAFPPGTVLAPGQAVRVYTDEVHPESGGFSYGIGRAIWNDAGDTARLFDAQGTLVSQLGYGSEAPPRTPQ
jgi:Lamin Tail Domain